MIVEMLGHTKSIVHQNVTEILQMQKICAKVIPRILTNRQKENCESVLHKLLQCVTIDTNFFKQVITNNETRVFQYHPKTKRQSSKWHTC